jgi:hypothetical protein
LLFKTLTYKKKKKKDGWFFASTQLLEQVILFIPSGVLVVQNTGWSPNSQWNPFRMIPGYGEYYRPIGRLLREREKDFFFLGRIWRDP